MASEGDYPKMCPCLDQVVVADGDAASKIKAPKHKRAVKRKPGPLGGSGNYCVFSRKTNKLVRCYKSQDSAGRVAKGFGPKFRVGPRKSSAD